MRRATALLALACASCSTTPTIGPSENLAVSAFAADAAEFPLRRVGVLPPRGLAPADARELQRQFSAELARRVTFELVPIAPADLVDVPGADRAGALISRPETIVALSKRHEVDALIALAATERTVFQPLRLTMRADLVASETGAVLWSAQGSWNTADQRVQASLESWYKLQRDTQSADEDWSLYLLSPARFASYACAQLADRYEPLPPPAGATKAVVVAPPPRDG